MQMGSPAFQGGERPNQVVRPSEDLMEDGSYVKRQKRKFFDVKDLWEYTAQTRGEDGLIESFGTASYDEYLEKLRAEKEADNERKIVEAEEKIQVAASPLKEPPKEEPDKRHFARIFSAEEVAAFKRAAGVDSNDEVETASPLKQPPVEPARPEDLTKIYSQEEVAALRRGGRQKPWWQFWKK